MYSTCKYRPTPSGTRKPYWYSLYRRAKYLDQSGNGKSMDFFGRGRNCQQSFSGFKVEANLEWEKLKISSRGKREKNHQGLCRLWRSLKNPASIWAAPYTVQSLGYGPATKAGGIGRSYIYTWKTGREWVWTAFFSSALYEGRGRALNTSWTHGGNDSGLDF